MISVIIPNFNGEALIETCLGALRRQTLSGDFFEILVVDNRSTDRSLQILNEMAETQGNLTVLEERAVQSSYAARNRGVEKARGRLFAFTDVDCRPDPGWLETASRYQDPKWERTLISGPVILEYHEEKPNAYELVDRYSSLNQEVYAGAGFGATANLLVPRRVMSELGGFEEVVSGGDQVFGRRAAAAGYDFHFDPELVVYHPARDTFAEIMEKARRVGRGIRQSYRLIHPSRSQRFLFVLKRLGGLLFPRNQIVLARKIFSTEEMSAPQAAQLLAVLLMQGFIQRLYFFLP